MRYEWSRNTGHSELREGIPDTDYPIAVLGYGGMSPHLVNGVTRKVAVSFQQLDDANARPFHKDVSFSHLRALRVGSVWQNKRHVGEVRYDDFGLTELDFSPGRCRLLSAITETQEGRPAPLNGRYRASTKDERKERSWLLEFTLPDKRIILVPCMEFFLRCYGVSELIPRALSSMSWDDAMKLFLVNTTREKSTEGKWVIRPTERMQDGDRAFLGHILHTSYGQRAAKSIADQCVTESKNQELIFPRVEPWFSGKVPVSARGIWVRERQTFLALRMELLGEPTGPGIVAVKMKKEEDSCSEDDQSSKQAREGRRNFTLSPESKLKVHIPNDAHNFGSPPPERRDPKGERFPLGPKRDITTIFERQSSVVLPPDGSNEPGVQLTSPDALDVPEAHRIVMAHGTLLEMWRALQALQAHHPENLLGIQWFHAERGFVNDDTPELIALQPFGENEQVKPDIRNWVTRDIKTEPPRGILVLRIQASVPKTLEKKTIYVLEVERRVKQRRASMKKVDEEADSYRGLAVVLAPTTDFDKWLRDVLSRIRYVAGHVVELESLHPNFIEAFKHSQSRTNNKMPFRASALLALKKAGVEL
ncbi:hypothetical protein KDX08_07185 [Burkholderia cenocepacia]|uniref:hypothetical protein n=1 Tax=Burkholderia cenocepacia TaxID=95486 RepID=UPI000B0D007B|nr:hypothetical protein [Burkholderia cenocepacia]MBR7992226.1 hypothetical protein [Burkholderia cenocepacia]